MNEDHDVLEDRILGSIDAAGDIDSFVSLPITTEFVVVNSGAQEDSASAKLNLQSSTLLNVENNYIVTPFKNGQSLSGRFVTLESNKHQTLTFLEPPAKRQKTDEDDSVKKMLASIQQSILERLESIEKKVEKMTNKCQCLEEKVESILLRSVSPDCNSDLVKKGRFGDTINGIPTDCSADGNFYSLLASLNSEDTYPEGSWLGNPDNEAFRVRCPISPKELVSVNETCTTPVKMALTLLDYLFDRETQACSNISGVGKHGKLQLDPIKIFGIRCHLMYIFGVTEQQWRRIKLNLDSKCRSAFRRKQKGMPLSVKGLRDKNGEFQDLSVKNEDCVQTNALSLLNELGASAQHCALVTLSEEDSPSDSVDGLVHPDDPSNMEISGIIHTDHGDIHVIQATLEQLAQLKESSQVEILSVASAQNRL